MLKDPTIDQTTRNQLIRIACYANFELFVRIFFKDHCPAPFSAMHRDFFSAEADPNRRGRRDVIAAPRGHAKTTFISLFKVIHAIVYGYEPYILIIGHSAPEAEGKVRDVLNELENNTLLHEVFGDLAPHRGQSGWGQRKFITQNGIKVESKSRGKQVRGLKHGNTRPTLIILDDIESPEKVLTEEQRYKTQQWLEKDVLKLGSVDGKANIIIIGTCLHPEALLPTLLASPGWNGRKYQAVISFAQNQALWQEWQTIYTDLTNPQRLQDAQAFYEANEVEMLAGSKVLWPEHEPYIRLMQIRVNEGQASFQSEKQNDPYDPERMIFDMAKAKRFKLEYKDGELRGIRWQDGSDRFIPWSRIDRIVAYHDPAMCENTDSDYAAIVVCACDDHGYLYCLDAYIEKVAPSRQIEQTIALCKKWNVDRLYLEASNFQGILKHNYRAAQDEHTFLRITDVKPHQNKKKRIASLEPLVTNGQLLFHVDLSPRLISQMQQFPTTADDGPDALHGAIDPLRKRVGLY